MIFLMFLVYLNLNFWNLLFRKSFQIDVEFILHDAQTIMPHLREKVFLYTWSIYFFDNSQLLFHKVHIILASIGPELSMILLCFLYPCSLLNSVPRLLISPLVQQPSRDQQTRLSPRECSGCHYLSNHDRCPREEHSTFSWNSRRNQNVNSLWRPN